MSGPRRRQMAVPLTPLPKRRQPPPIAIALGVGLAILAFAIVIVLAGQGGPSATPTRLAVASSTVRPSSSAISSSSSGISSTSAPPTQTLLPSVGPTAPASSGESSAPPTRLPKTPEREVVFTSLGIDNPVAPEATERQLTFNVDGRGDITSTVSDITAGLVRMCLWPGDGSTFPEESDCVTTPDDVITREAAVAGPWTVSLTGAQAGRSPAITLVLQFPSTAPQLVLKNIRFQGQDSPNYTGFDMKVTALADGELTIAASWDNGLATNYPYTLSLLDLSVEFEEPVKVEGVSTLAAAERAVIAEHTYQVTITNLQEEIIEAVFLRATVTWP